MRAALPLLILACLAASAPAAEATKPSAPKSTEATPPPPPEKHTRFRPLMVPVYLVIGLPRDIIDAPVKGISAIPIVNRVLHARGVRRVGRILTAFAQDVP